MGKEPNVEEVEFEDLHSRTFSEDEEEVIIDDGEELILTDDEKPIDDEEEVVDEEEDDEPSEEDEDEVEDDEEDDEVDEDLKGLPKKQLNRIMRERRLAQDRDRARIAAEEEAAQARREAQQAIAQLHETQRVAARSILEKLDSDIEQTNRAIITAREEGNTEQELVSQQKLSELRETKQKVSMAQANIPPPEQDAYTPQPGYQQSRQEHANTTMARQWKEQNPWFSDGSHAAARGAVLGITQEMDKSDRWGGRGHTPEYFAELNKRLRKTFPTMKGIRSVNGKLMPVTVKKKPKKQPVAGASGSTGASKNTGKQKLAKDGLPVMTPDMVKTMRQWDLNPNDPKHRKAFRKAVLEV